MTDADLLSRVQAYDSAGRLTAWTPEAIAFRLVEAAVVFSRTPARIGPTKLRTAWPAMVVTAQDLVDESTQARLMRFPHLVGSWESKIDAPTLRHMSREKQVQWDRPSAPTPDQYSRAEEALSWPMRYLRDRPLIADAVTLWALCKATGASLRATIRQRVIDADEARYGGRRHDRGMRRQAAKRGAVVEGKPLTRQEVMPGKNFDKAKVNDRRKEAVEIICIRLIADRVLVREADEALSGQSERQIASPETDEA